MKKIKLFMMAILLSSITLAQTFPVGSPPTPFVLPNQAQSAWY